jgi:hypothetical protein
VSVSGVLVSLQVMTMQPIRLGAWALCSRWEGRGAGDAVAWVRGLRDPAVLPDVRFF